MIEKKAEPKPLTEQDQKLIKIAAKLIDVEIMTRDEDDDLESHQQQSYTPEEVQAIAKRLVIKFKEVSPDSGNPTKEFKAFFSKNKNSF